MTFTQLITQRKWITCILDARCLLNSYTFETGDHPHITNMYIDAEEMFVCSEIIRVWGKIL